jgi:hypothetical protein
MATFLFFIKFLIIRMQKYTSGGSAYGGHSNYGGTDAMSNYSYTKSTKAN